VPEQRHVDVAIRDRFKPLDELQLGHHAPAEPARDRRDKLARAGHAMPRRRGAGRDLLEHVALQRIRFVVLEHGRGREPRLPVGEPARAELGRRDREVAHPAERPHRAALHRLAIGADRRHNDALAQQLGRARLVVAVKLEDDLARERGERGQHPGDERVGVHCDGQGCGGVLAQGVLGFAREQLELAGEAQQGAAVLGRPHGPGAHEQHAPDVVLEGPDALAHGRRGDVEFGGGRVKGAVIDDCDEGAEASEIEFHKQF